MIFHLVIIYIFGWITILGCSEHLKEWRVYCTVQMANKNNHRQQSDMGQKVEQK